MTFTQRWRFTAALPASLQEAPRLVSRGDPSLPRARALCCFPVAMAAAPRVFDMAADEGAVDPWYDMTAGEEAAFLAGGSADAAADASVEDGGFGAGEEAHLAARCVHPYEPRQKPQ